jgi:hypothetical protein
LEKAASAAFFFCIFNTALLTRMDALHGNKEVEFVGCVATKKNGHPKMAIW